MAKTIRALYQNGIFKPLTRVRLKDRQRVELTVVERGKPAKTVSKSVQRRLAPLRDTTSHPAYRIVGVFKSGVRDLSKQHDRYLYS